MAVLGVSAHGCLCVATLQGCRQHVPLGHTPAAFTAYQESWRLLMTDSAALKLYEPRHYPGCAPANRSAFPFAGVCVCEKTAFHVRIRFQRTIHNFHVTWTFSGCALVRSATASGSASTARWRWRLVALSAVSSLTFKSSGWTWLAPQPPASPRASPRPAQHAAACSGVGASRPSDPSVRISVLARRKGRAALAPPKCPRDC